MVASGPTLPDDTTRSDAVEWTRSLGLANALPDAHRDLAGGDPPARTHPAFDRSLYQTLVDNDSALELLRTRAHEFGWRVVRESAFDEVRYEDAARGLLDGTRVVPLTTLVTAPPADMTGVVAAVVMQAAGAAGIAFPELCDRIVRLAAGRAGA